MASSYSLLRLLVLALHCGVAVLQLLPRCSAAAAPPVSGDVSALLAFKRAVIEDPLSALADWSDADGNACDWRGVICSSPHGSVVSLRLSNASLKGFIAPELGQLTFLQELYLDHNLLFGTIPGELGSLENLRIIHLQSNALTGNVPPELGKLQNLVELRLDGNRLKGSIPGSNATGFSPMADTGLEAADRESSSRDDFVYSATPPPPSEFAPTTNWWSVAIAAGIVVCALLAAVGVWWICYQRGSSKK